MPRIRLCLLVDTVGYGAGTERQVAETVRRLDPAIFEVHLCCLEDSTIFRGLASCCRTELFPLRRLYTPGGVFQMGRFRRYITQHGIDIVHAFMVKTSIFGVLAACGPGRPVVITSRLNTGYWYTPVYVQLFRFLNRYTTRVFANSAAAARIAAGTEALPLHRIDVVYQGVDADRFAHGNASIAASLGIPEGARVVGMVANFRPVKDVPLFLRAAGIVAAQVPDAVFLLAGAGPDRESLGRLAAELGIAGKVFFSDGRGAIPDYLARMSVGCLSSEGEGLSNAILEYMAAGLPTVATDVGGNRELIVHGKTGYLINERTPEALAAAINELLGNESLRAAMGRRALERCRESFAIDVTIRKLEGYYTELHRKHCHAGKRQAASDAAPPARPSGNLE